MSDESNQDDIDKLMGDDPGGSDGANSGDAAAAAGGGENAPGYEEMEDNAADEAAKASQNYDIGEPMANDVAAIYDIPVQISAVLGRSSMQVSQLLKLGRGAVVELDRKVGEAIDIYVNNRLVARGEVVVVEDKLGVTMTEIVKSDRN